MARHRRHHLVALGMILLGMLVLSRSIVGAAPPWVAPQSLAQGNVDPQGAALAVDSAGRVHVVWSAEGWLWHRVRTGESWSPAQGVMVGHTPDLAADAAGHVHLVCAAQAEGADEIYWISWTASEGWGLPTNLSETPEDSSAPRLAVAADGALAVVWSETTPGGPRVYLARSADGITWSSAPVPNAWGVRPVVTWGPGNALWVAWQEPLDEGLPDEIWCAQWTSEGWTLPVDISASPAAASVAPALAAHQEGVFLAWQEMTAEGPRIFTARWDRGNWSSPAQRSSGTGFAPWLALSAQGQGYLAWTGDRAVEARPWSAPTDTWSPVEEVAGGLEDPAEARLALGAVPYALWLAPDGQGGYDLLFSLRGEPAPAQRLFLPLIRRS